MAFDSGLSVVFGLFVRLSRSFSSTFFLLLFSFLFSAAVPKVMMIVYFIRANNEYIKTMYQGILIYSSGY